MIENTEQPKPDRASFSFDDFVQKKATTPTILHRVFLDSAAGLHRAELEDEIGVLRVELGKLEAKNDNLTKRSVSLGEVGDLPGRIQALTKRIQDMEKEFDQATADILEGSMVFELRWDTMEGPQEIIMQAQDKWFEDNGLDGTDPLVIKNLTNKQREDQGMFISCALTAAAIKRVIYPDNSVHEGNLPIEKIRHLTNEVLILSEKQKLHQAVNKSVGTTDDWFGNIDAGFPR